MRFLGRTIACAMLVLLFPAASHAAGPEELTVAAAADLAFALKEIGQQFQDSTGCKVTFSFGSTGTLALQIANGAPFDIFAAANVKFIEDLKTKGLIIDDSQQLYARGRIVVAVSKKAGVVSRSLKDLQNPAFQKIAIANPDHAPYGLRAREALQHAGLWEALGPKLVLGENVSQAAQFATSGDAQGGIIAYSLALAPEVSALGDYALIPAAWHSPLQQRMVLLKSAGPVAEAFYAYMNSDPARAIMERYGFALPQ